MDEQKTLEIILKFGLQEEEKAKQAAKNLGGVTAQFASLQREVKNTKKAIEIALAHGEDTKELEKNLDRVKANMAAVSVQALDLNRKMDQIKWQKLEKTGQALKNIGGQMQQIGQGMALLGGGVLAGVFASIQKYNEKSPFEAPSMRWISAQKDIESSYVRIGAVAADKVLPVVEKLADLAEKTADFVEKNPKVIEALVGFGGFMAGGGMALSMLGGLANTAGGLMDITGKYGPAVGGAVKGGLGTAGKAALGFLGSAAGAATLGLGAGVLAYDNLIATEGSGRAKSGTVLGQTASVAAYGVGSLFSEETARDLYTAVGELTGVIEKQTEAEQRNPTQPASTPETLQLYADYQAAINGIEAAEERHEQERLDLVNEFGAQRTALETRYESRRVSVLTQYAEQALKATSTFVKNEARTERDYYAQRQQAAQRYGVEVARMEADHQKEMRRMLEDHNLRSDDLVSSRDALGLVKEQREYEINRRRAEEDYGVQAAIRSQDYAQQMREMESNFAKARARRLQDFQEQQAEREAEKAARLLEMQAQFEQEMIEFDKNAQERQNKLAEQQSKELLALKKNAEDREKMLTAIAVNGMTQTQYQAQRLLQQFDADFKKWLGTRQTYGTYGGLVGPPKPPGYENGGYVAQRGVYELAERGREYVLNNRTTKAAERLLGQKLTQQNLLQSLAGARGGSTVNLSFPGGLVTMPMLADILRQNTVNFGNLLADTLDI